MRHHIASSFCDVFHWDSHRHFPRNGWRNVAPPWCMFLRESSWNCSTDVIRSMLPDLKQAKHDSYPKIEHMSSTTTHIKFSNLYHHFKVTYWLSLVVWHFGNLQEVFKIGNYESLAKAAVPYQPFRWSTSFVLKLHGERSTTFTEYCISIDLNKVQRPLIRIVPALFCGESCGSWLAENMQFYFTPCFPFLYDLLS